MTATCATLTRPELAERVLASGARLGELPIARLRPLVDEQLVALRQAGASTGSVVAVEEAGPQEFLASILAAWTLNAVPLPCKDASGTPLADRAVTLVGTRARPPAVSGEIGGLESTAVLHLTSGSTGDRKVARRGCDSVLNEAEGYRPGLALGPEDRVYVPVPLAHSYGWGVALGALLAGCQLDVSPVVHARRAVSRLEAATVAALTAPIAGLFARTPGSRPPRGSAGGLRVAMVGASRVTAQLDDAFDARFGLRLSRNYGSSETGATFIGGPGLADGAIGHPMPGVTVLGPQPGAEGELRLVLPPVEGCLGCPDPPAQVWNTGDLVRRGEDGVVTFVARVHETLRLNDRTVDVPRLQEVLRSISGVVDVFVLSAPRPDGTVEDLYAVVAGADVDRAQAEKCRPDFPDGAQSVRLVYTDRLPVSALGKPDRGHLIELVRAEWRRR
ncbi:MAG TPA: AMP-binding protein [Jatrophihabitans sp.]|jgi:acyl-CoA synthetase (AMP-forming)/AMP-acid ligase II|nr:AMP-binding protein [Jatrophihabitans sp.]